MTSQFDEPLQMPDTVEIHSSHCFNHLTTVAKTGQKPGCLWLPRAVTFDSNTNKIFVVEGWFDFARVSIFSETGEFTDTFSHEQMEYPWGIAIYGDNVYVTDTINHLILHFKVASVVRFVASSGGKGSGKGKFNEPRQLTSSGKGELFVSDRNNHRIQIFDGNLNYLRQISHHSIREPCDVKLTANEIYVLCLPDSPCLHVFSLTGHKLRSLVTRGIGMQVVCPLFFCLTADGNIIISDWWTSQVQMFSSGGELLNQLGGVGSEVGVMQSPKGITLVNNLKLVVISQNINFSLQIFCH